MTPAKASGSGGAICIISFPSDEKCASIDASTSIDF